MWYLIVSIPDLCTLTYFILAINTFKLNFQPPNAQDISACHLMEDFCAFLLGFALVHFFTEKAVLFLFRATDNGDSSKATATCTVAITDVVQAWSADSSPYFIRVSKSIAGGMYFFVLF